MRLVTVLTTILLGGSATIASAQPAHTPDWRNELRGDYYNARVPAATWVVLAPSVGTARARAVIPVGANTGRFEKLRIRGDLGRVYVRSVGVFFHDGTAERINVGRVLAAGEFVDLDLQGRFRMIKYVSINTERRGVRSPARYTVSAARAVVTPQYGYAPRSPYRH